MEISDSIWWTRKARIQTEKRLLANAFQTQLILLWYSFVGVGVSVYNLQPCASVKMDSITWVVFSILILCISGFINGLSFKERAGLVKECYETLNRIYQKSKSDTADPDAIGNEYDQILSVCENHSDEDFHIAICLEYKMYHSPEDARNSLTKLPTKHIWYSYYSSKIKRALLLGALYIFPIILIYFLSTMP